MSKPYVCIKDGEPIEFTPGTPDRLGCCDCGLVHVLILDYKDDKITLEAWRDTPSTERIRAYRRKEKGK